MSDAKVLLEIVGRAGSWLTSARAAAKREGDRRAAHLLHDAGIVVAAMRSYDNVSRRLYTRLAAFHLDWDADRRKTLAEELLDYLARFEILPYLDQGVTSLRAAAPQVEDDDLVTALLGELISSGKRLLGGHDECLGMDRALEPAPFDWARDFVVEAATGHAQEPERFYLVRALETGSTVSHAEFVRGWARRNLQLLDSNRDVISRADRAFAKLRQHLVSEHHLPQPGWAVDLKQVLSN